MRRPIVILDWLLALERVRDNMGQFGGDPARVTITGQSAGGGAVMAICIPPLSRRACVPG
jgi:para-nitrobenzyl esterase